MKSASSALVGAILLGCQGATAGASSVETIRPTTAGRNQIVGELSASISRMCQPASDACRIPIRHVHDSNCGCDVCCAIAASPLFRSLRP